MSTFGVVRLVVALGAPVLLWLESMRSAGLVQHVLLVAVAGIDRG